MLITISLDISIKKLVRLTAHTLRGKDLMPLNFSSSGADLLMMVDNLNPAGEASGNLKVFPYTISYAAYETFKISTGWFLEDAQLELWYDRQQVVEDICLDVLVLNPVGRVGEDIDFNWQTSRSGVKLPDKERQILVNLWMVV
jgi:hypothetical protein